MDVKKQEVYLKDWQGLTECAERMLPLIGHLYRDNNIVTTVFGRPLVNSTTIDILKAHRFARLILDHELCVLDTFPILEEIAKLDLAPARIDIGKLITRYQAQGSATSIADFVRQELAAINTGRAPVLDEPQDDTLSQPRRTAGWTAVPVAAEIIRRVAPLMGLRPIMLVGGVMAHQGDDR